MQENLVMRFCPKCETERSVHELFCEGKDGEQRCGWSLAEHPIKASGWRPSVVVTVVDSIGTGSFITHDSQCNNGHPLAEGDLLCNICGEDQRSEENESTYQIGTENAAETVIEGWQLLKQINFTASQSDRYEALETSTGRKGILTLYHQGSEPDPTVYDSLQRVSREHVPEVFLTGRWNDRAFEIAEALNGKTLADLGILTSSIENFKKIIFELGTALSALAEVGLRHRDIRPSNLLVRELEPLDLVIGGFGSSRLSEFDLDIVSPLEITRYTAPEALAGGVAAASDWWSLGMVLLEQITAGQCFEEINEHAFLIHVLSNGVPIPDDIDPDLNNLLRGLLNRDRITRWKWPQVKSWLNGEVVAAPARINLNDSHEKGSSITLGKVKYFDLNNYALSAAELSNWDEALDQFNRGTVTNWASENGADPNRLAGLRRLAQHDFFDENFKLLVVLKVLNPEMPHIYKGDIVTPKWLLENPLEGYELITGEVPDLLLEFETNSWLGQLKSRAESVRKRAKNLNIELDEDTLRINLLSTSRVRLAAEWEERRKLLPDTDHHGLLSLIERRVLSEEDLIVVLSSPIGLFKSSESLIEEAKELANKYAVTSFVVEEAVGLLSLSRSDLIQEVTTRVEGFARSSYEIINGWVDQFRLDKRVSLAQALVILAIPQNLWQIPQKQQYISKILEFFEKKIVASVMRGPLVRMTIGKTTPRVDLCELGTDRLESSSILDHILLRNDRELTLDPSVFDMVESNVENRLQSIERSTNLHKRDTGIDGLYLGFPFLLVKDAKSTTTTRIAPLLIWPVKIHHELGLRGKVTLAFDSEREEVRVNPALEGILGYENSAKWKKGADELLGRSSIKASDVIDAFGTFATARSRNVVPLPDIKFQLPPNSIEIQCSAVIFHVNFIGQAIGEDIRQLKAMSSGGTGLETLLRLNSGKEISKPEENHKEIQKFFTVQSDPSQEDAVLRARVSPGLVVEGPPGTGKSQTIVNMVGDAIGRRKCLLIVCQKHAALEVVHKRLIAEGLGERIIMINDVNKDRNPIIRSVREQIEMLARNKQDLAAVFRRKREDVGARIESLESALNNHQDALHHIDENIGISYRGLIGELIQLENPSPPIDIPALRPKLELLSLAELATLEEEIAPIVRYWLPAKYEGSVLSNLKTFHADPATVEDFTNSFFEFMKSESLRLQVLLANPPVFEIDDPAPHRNWLSAYGNLFLNLEPLKRSQLAKWLILFRSEVVNEKQGLHLINELRELKGVMDSLPFQELDLKLFESLPYLSEGKLSQWKKYSEEALVKVSFFTKFNLLRFVRQRKLRSFMEKVGLEPSISNFQKLLINGDLEQRLRPLRNQLSNIHEQLGLSELETDISKEIVVRTDETLSSLEEINQLCSNLETAPLFEKIERVIKAGSRDLLVRLYADYDVAFARCEVRLSSFQALKNLESWFNPDWIMTTCESIKANQVNMDSIRTIESALPSLVSFQYFRSRAERFSSETTEILSILRSKEPQLALINTLELEDAARRILNREARLGWKRAIEKVTPDLMLEREELITKITSLAKLEQEMREANRELLKNDFEFEQIRPLKDWEDITRLTGQRARRLREFIDLGSKLGLMKLRPIWLMNPDVASRVLPLQSSMFDAVIYDEASQMPVEFALPTLYRADSAIVSGDEKQMPPTNFFSSKIESDELEAFDGNSPDENASDDEKETFDETWNRREIKDCPDLLQLARTSLPNCRLQIHYRSAFRELINFSNAAFYNNDLSVPVRHSDGTILQIKPIEMIRVNGTYHDQTNISEAHKVVDILKVIWKKPYSERPSVGVVTFNRKQADLIEEVMENEAENNIEFREAYRLETMRLEDGEDMGVFVKNVENVQGDERDVIIFSSTFGNNRQGSFRRSFGVLGQKGGERRLNVAVTRARKKVYMITSMPINDISDVLTTRKPLSTPRDYLQGYMEYARCISAGDLASASSLLARWSEPQNKKTFDVSHHEDGFCIDVRKYMENLGNRVASTSENDAFGLDYAIENPVTGLFAIGIECDAPRHELLKSARAREVWRPQVLKRAVPIIHRVSSQGWYQDSVAEKLRLKEAIERALKVST